MAYLGNAPARSFISFERQVFTIVNSQTAYTLDHSVNNENDIRFVINNIVQEPGSGKAYTLGVDGSSEIWDTAINKTGASTACLTTTAGSSSGSREVLTGVVLG